MNHFINISDLSKSELRSIIDSAKKRKSERGEKPNSQPDMDQPLQGKTVIMIFEKTSTRTRISSDLAVRQLGGSSIILNQDEIHYGKGDECIKDTAKVLSQYADILMIRTNSHKNVEEFKKYLDIPIINLLTDSGHPSQVMSDILTFEELKGNIKGKTIAWIGDGNNVCNSLILGCAKLKIKLSVAVPDGYEPDLEVAKIGKDAEILEISDNPELAVKDADVIMTDTFVSIHNTNPDRVKKFLPKFQVNQSLMNKAKKDAIFMHCLPAKRDQEVTSDVIDGSQSVVWDEAENRLHVQKALLVHLLGV